MRIIIAMLLCLLAAPATAQAAGSNGAESSYDILFGKTMWLNTSRPVTAEDAKGRAVLLDFWTYGCINCMQVIPDLKALEKEFGDKLLVIGVHSAKFVGERDSDRIQAAAKRFGITHPVINDSEFKVWNAMAVKAWPTLVLLGPDGKEVGRYAGEGNREKIAADIKKMSLGDVKTVTLYGPSWPHACSTAWSFPSRLVHSAATPWGAGIFVADTSHDKIVGLDEEGKRKLYIGSGYEGAEDGDFKKATFNHPRGIAVTAQGIYIADTGNHLIRYADFKSETVTTVAGTGERGLYARVTDRPARDIPLASPWDIAFMKDGKTLVIAMAGLHQLWSFDTEKGTVSTLAGTAAEGIKDGPAAEATLAQPSGLSIVDDAIYFVDAESSALRVLKDGEVKTLIGTGLFDFGLKDGKYPDALLQHAQGLYAQNGKILIADTYNNALRRYDIAAATLDTVKTPRDALSEPAAILPLGGKWIIAHEKGLKALDTATGEVKGWGGGGLMVCP